MADSGADRQRRHRKHVAGDHSECDASRCHILKAALNGHGQVEDFDPSGSISEAFAAYVADLGLQAGDPKSAIAATGMRVAERLDDEIQPMLVREYLAIVNCLSEQPRVPGGALDEIRARRAERRVRHVLDQRLKGDAS